MPKIAIDYSNTIIYKITCKYENIQDVYVGHTTNFVQRKYAHKISCTNINSFHYNCYVYQVIRNNGGWDNWKMEIIDYINCKDLDDAINKEREYGLLHKATLNQIPLHRKSTPANKENTHAPTKQIHLETSYVKYCKQNELCKYVPIENNDIKPENNRNLYVCHYCPKSYKYHSGLWRHRQECNETVKTNADGDVAFNTHEQHDDVYNEQILDNSSEVEPDVDVEVEADDTDDDSIPKNKIIRRYTPNESNNNKIKNRNDENQEMKKMMMTMMNAIMTNTNLQTQMIEMMKATQHTTVNTSTTGGMTNITVDNGSINSHNNNNSFSMNVFLNEQCKDAMNMKDFVNSIQLNLTDLENVERDGYVKGMSNILIDNLQKTDVYKRPVHCSDVKRETLYVKDNNEWEQDGPDHPKMVNAVLAVEHKNVALVSEWAKANPRCMNSSSKENERYMKLSKAATDGEKEGNIAKVIKRVAKNVAIDKESHTNGGGGSALD